VDLVNAVAIIRKSNYVSLSKVASIHRGRYGRFERHRVEIGILKVLFPRHTNKSSIYFAFKFTFGHGDGIRAEFNYQSCVLFRNLLLLFITTVRCSSIT